MAAFLSALPACIASDPDSTTRRDKGQARAAVAKFSYRWTVTERTDRPIEKGMARRHLVVEMDGAVAMPAFRLDRHGQTVVLSEHDETGAWTVGRFDGMDEALAALRRAAMARFAGAGDAPAAVPDHAAAVRSGAPPGGDGRPDRGARPADAGTLPCRLRLSAMAEG